MAHNVKEPPQPYVAPHVRREELIRPAGRHREFPKREAQRRLQEKESRWAPIAYGVFLGAVAVIFCITYMTYVFSKYRGEILPGVQVDRVAVGGLTAKQAARLIDNSEAAIGHSPVRLTYGTFPAWEPTQSQIGFYPEPQVTAKRAMDIGRTESMVEQLVDRLPLHPSHTVPLAYSLDEAKLRAYIHGSIVSKVNIPPANASIKGVDATGAFVLRPSADGLQLDVADAERAVHAVLGSLTKQTRRLKAVHTTAAISNAAAELILKRANRFLSATPVLGIGKRVTPTKGSSFYPMITFNDRKDRKTARWSIEMKVNSVAIHNYVSTLASQIDRPAQNARVNFQDGRVQIVSPRREGRTLNQDAAYNAILRVVSALKPRSQIHLIVATTQPPIDTTNPASLGINHLLGEASTNFVGGGDIRLQGVTQIGKALNDSLITPTQEISFNTLVGTSWENRVYDDRERSVNGQIVPGNHGAMQQVATTFLRAMYAAGMRVLERHAHSFRLGWYELPVGLDAVVLPGRNWDLRFANSAHKYLLIETRVEPIKEQLYVYVYGPDLKWKVSVDRLGKVAKRYPHGPPITRQDPGLSPGTEHQTSWAHDGADTIVQRTITYHDGKVKVDEIDTHYLPWQAVVNVGAVPTPTPTPTATAKHHRTGGAVTATPTVQPQPTPSPTFNH